MMKNILTISILFLFKSANAQGFGNHLTQTQFQEPENYGSFLLVQRFNKPHEVNFGNVKFPSEYSDEQKQKVLDLLNELESVCPECSNGGTIQGPTVIGGNRFGETIFPVRRLSNQTVTLATAYYEELKSKANNNCTATKNGDEK